MAQVFGSNHPAARESGRDWTGSWRPSGSDTPTQKSPKGLGYALYRGKLDMDKALRFMIGSGLIEEHVRHGTTFYSMKKRHSPAAGRQRN